MLHAVQLVDHVIGAADAGIIPLVILDLDIGIAGRERVVEDTIFLQHQQAGRKDAHLCSPHRVMGQHPCGQVTHEIGPDMQVGQLDQLEPRCVREIKRHIRVASGQLIARHAAPRQGLYPGIQSLQRIAQQLDRAGRHRAGLKHRALVEEHALQRIETVGRARAACQRGVERQLGQPGRGLAFWAQGDGVVIAP